MKQNIALAKQKPNSTDWKRTLQVVIDRNNSQHTRKRKTVGHRTMDQRPSGLFRSFTTLRDLGFKFSPLNLGGRHIEILVRYLTADPSLFPELKASNTQTASSRYLVRTA